jgi:hypothetical protein
MGDRDFPRAFETNVHTKHVSFKFVDDFFVNRDHPNRPPFQGTPQGMTSGRCDLDEAVALNHDIVSFTICFLRCTQYTSLDIMFGKFRSEERRGLYRSWWGTETA